MKFEAMLEVRILDIVLKENRVCWTRFFEVITLLLLPKSNLFSMRSVVAQQN